MYNIIYLLLIEKLTLKILLQYNRKALVKISKYLGTKCLSESFIFLFISSNFFKFLTLLKKLKFILKEHYINNSKFEQSGNRNKIKTLY